MCGYMKSLSVQTLETKVDHLLQRLNFGLQSQMRFDLDFELARYMTKNHCLEYYDYSIMTPSALCFLTNLTFKLLICLQPGTKS